MNRKFEDSSELGRGRGKSIITGSAPGGKMTSSCTVLGRGRGSFGSNPLGTGRGVGKGFESWRNAKPQSFKHRWDFHKSEGSGHNQHIEQEQVHKSWMNLMKEVTVVIECLPIGFLDSPRWSFRCMTARGTHSNGYRSVKTSSNKNKHRQRLGSAKQLSPYRIGQAGGVET